MIESVTIKGVATYSIEGIKIENLKPVNFIYGANGSGKTTISNFLADQKRAGFGSCSLKWENDQPVKIYVYNKEFREKNFFKGDIPGVFTIGSASVEQVRLLKAKEDEITKLRDQALDEKKRLKAYDEQLEKESSRFKELIWDRFKKPLTDTFKEAFSGSSYKDTFLSRLLSEAKTNGLPVPLLAELEEKAKTIFGPPPVEVGLIDLIDSTRIEEIEDHPIWTTPILGKSDVPIAGLIHRLNNNDWVDQGRQYIEDNICPFCQQKTVDNHFKLHLEEFFDESYKRSLSEIEALKNEYSDLSSTILKHLEAIKEREKSDQNTKLNWETLTPEIEVLKSRLEANQRVIESKLKEPSRKLATTSLTDVYSHLNERLTNANQKIDEHNGIVNSFQTAKAELVKSVWKYIVDQSAQTLDTHKKTVAGIEKSRSVVVKEQEETTKRGKALRSEIQMLTKETSGVEFSIQEINRILTSYGFNSFRVVPSPSNPKCYQIQREDGTLADTTLSEGEITFITFLYFFQRAKGGDSELSVGEQRILVVDDPISSLDSNVLFIVSSLLRSYVEEIRAGNGRISQLLLLTHNAYFHKQMSIIEGRQQERPDTSFWILRKIGKWTTVESYEKRNPISSTYELLWRELRPDQQTSRVLLQNAMRRILEYYFTVFGQFSNIKRLPSKFNTMEEQMVCKSLLGWVHDGSHDIVDEINITDQNDSLERYHRVFKEIFRVYNQLGHYNLMMGIDEDNND